MLSRLIHVFRRIRNTRTHTSHVIDPTFLVPPGFVETYPALKVPSRPSPVLTPASSYPRGHVGDPKTRGVSTDRDTWGSGSVCDPTRDTRQWGSRGRDLEAVKVSTGHEEGETYKGVWGGVNRGHSRNFREGQRTGPTTEGRGPRDLTGSCWVRDSRTLRRPKGRSDTSGSPFAGTDARRPRAHTFPLKEGPEGLGGRDTRTRETGTGSVMNSGPQ